MNLCVGEETERQYIGEVLDANDVIRILKGPTAIGVSHTPVPKKKTSLFGLMGQQINRKQHFAVSKAQIERAHTVVSQALAELSIDCENEKIAGVTYYDADNVLGLFAGPTRETTEEIVEMMDNYFAERVPGARRRKGTYPGRTSDTISVTVIVSGIGAGVAKDRVEWYYKKATSMLSKVKEKRKGRDKTWVETSKTAERLPNL